MAANNKLILQVEDLQTQLAAKEAHEKDEAAYNSKEASNAGAFCRFGFDFEDPTLAVDGVTVC